MKKPVRVEEYALATNRNVVEVIKDIREGRLEGRNDSNQWYVDDTDNVVAPRPSDSPQEGDFPLLLLFGWIFIVCAVVAVFIAGYMDVSPGYGDTVNLHMLHNQALGFQSSFVLLISGLILVSAHYVREG